MTDDDIKNIALHSALLRYGQICKLDIYYNPNKFLSNISEFENNWVKYNPYKPQVPRDGLSITSIDGGMSGVPDLTSMLEYNRSNNTQFRETDIVVPTPVYPHALPYFDFIKDHIFRTHVLRLPPGGFFPPHRDAEYSLTSPTIRLLVPISYCNPPTLFFMYGHNYSLVNFDHGHVYFVNTLNEHVLFNASTQNSSFMIVMNVKLNDESVTSILKHFSSK